MIFGIIVGVVVIAYVAVLIHEIRNAEEVDPKLPFLWGDYDPLKDPTLQENKDHQSQES